MEKIHEKTTTISSTIFALLLSANVMAGDTQSQVDLDKVGDRIENRLDNKGDS